MHPHEGTILMTGATGLIGFDVLQRLLAEHPALRVLVLVRHPLRWQTIAARLARGLSERVTPVPGDIRAPELGLTAPDRERIGREATAMIHLAADTVFSRPLAEARATNTDGTSTLLELAERCRSLSLFTFVSTAFVAGRRTGSIPERDNGSDGGWVNAYEQSKYEAEAIVRATRLPWVIVRPSTIVCDSANGTVSQFNAVHRALRLYNRGLAAMMPGSSESPVDVVPSDYVSEAIARLALRSELAGSTMHLCAGAGALPLGELLEITYGVWATDPEWRRRAISRPALADADTYSLFERSVEETGNPMLRQIIRSLSHFVPHLALEKRFQTCNADAALGYRSPPVREYWQRMIEGLARSKWGVPISGRAA